jgi:hypothetical protein
MTRGTHLFGLPNVLQVGLELAVAAHKFSQCNVAFHGLEVQGIGILVLIGALFPPSVAPGSQEGFGVTELMLFASAPWLPSPPV